MNNKDDLLDELRLLRDSFVPITHSSAWRELRDVHKERLIV